MVKVGPTQVYAAGLLDNDELAELVDSSIPNVIPSESRPPYSGNGIDVTERRTTVSQVQVPFPRPKATMEGIGLPPCTAKVYCRRGALLDLPQLRLASGPLQLMSLRCP